MNELLNCELIYNTTQENKERYGEVFSNQILIENMLNLLPTHVFENEKLKWLDPGCGKGNFSILLFRKLYKSLKNKITCDDKRKKHIIENMIYMVEINLDNAEYLKQLFGLNFSLRKSCD